MKKLASMEAERNELLALMRETISLHNRLDEFITRHSSKDIVCGGLGKGCDDLMSLNIELGDSVGLTITNDIYNGFEIKL